MSKKFTSRMRAIIMLCTMLGLAGCAKVTGVLDPQGVVAYVERKLLFDSTALILVVIIPVIIMSIDFVYHYRASNHEKQVTTRKIEYKPDWSHSVFLEALWWGVPCVVILVLSIMTWIFTHKLDPYRTLIHPGEKLQVQVVALPWKWLFIYPDQNIAMVNHLVLPKEQQVEFSLTTDNVPMSAFFIPQLGSQIYTMAGMTTKLHIIALNNGRYQGLNSQFNGKGFSDMRFDVDVKELGAFNEWAKNLKETNTRVLDSNSYKDVRMPMIKAPVVEFSAVQEDLFRKIVASYKNPEHPTW